MPKSISDGASKLEAMPIPDSGIFTSPSLVSKSRLAVNVPSEPGVKLMVKSQLPGAGTVEQLELVTVNKLLSTPVKEIEVIDKVVGLIFVNVRS